MTAPFLYVESTIPPGVTISQWRKATHPRKRRRWWSRPANHTTGK